MAKKITVGVGTVKGAFFFHSDEARQEWSVTGPHLSGWEVSCLHRDPQSGRILVGTCHMAYGASFRISEDSGETWREIVDSPLYAKDDGRTLNRIWQVSEGAASRPKRLYAGVDDAGLSVSEDSGNSWAEVAGLARYPGRDSWTSTKGGLCLHSILAAPEDAQRLWVAVSDGGVFRTEDGGETWEACYRGLPRGRSDADHSGNPETVRGVHKIALDPHDSNILYLQHHCGVFQSVDAGRSWFAICEGLPGGFGFPIEVTSTGDVFVAPLDDSTRCFIGGKLALYRRKTNSPEWEGVQSGLPEMPYFSGVLRDSLTVDTFKQTGIYFGTTQGDLFYSANNGETWGSLPGRYSRVVAVKAWVHEG